MRLTFSIPTLAKESKKQSKLLEELVRIGGCDEDTILKITDPGRYEYNQQYLKAQAEKKND